MAVGCCRVRWVSSPCSLSPHTTQCWGRLHTPALPWLALGSCICFPKKPSAEHASTAPHPPLPACVSTQSRYKCMVLKVMPCSVIFHTLNEGGQTSSYCYHVNQGMRESVTPESQFSLERALSASVWVSTAPGTLGPRFPSWVLGCCCYSSNKCIPRGSKLTAVNCPHARYSLWCITSGY